MRIEMWCDRSLGRGKGVAEEAMALAWADLPIQLTVPTRLKMSPIDQPAMAAKGSQQLHGGADDGVDEW